ncbi:MAG: NAD(P)-dependent oxidoreductase [Deltaproteobacteria bacterium]|nr:NAD(P)-dependent oxidoreductase [Deltaproteobacteria bacterium]
MADQALKGKTVLVTGASRGIGRAIALRCAKGGANLVLAAKSVQPHPKLQGTVTSVAKEVEKAGGRALPLGVDVRDYEQIDAMVAQAVKTFGGIDILVNNAGALKMVPVAETSPKIFDLVNGINVRSAFLCARACLPYLEKSSQAHILNLSPPLSWDPKWLKGRLAYTISKYGMSLCTLGMADEFRAKKIAVNSLWPKTVIDTAAIEWIAGKEARRHCRTPEIVADAAYALFTNTQGKVTGQTLVDEDFLRTQGVDNFSHYACEPGNKLAADFYIEDPQLVSTEELM